MAKDGPDLGKRPFYLPLGRNDECIGGIHENLPWDGEYSLSSCGKAFEVALHNIKGGLWVSYMMHFSDCIP